MITDDERREVARRLRELHPEDRSWWGIHGFDWYMFADYLFEAIGFDKGDCNGWTDLLADLIEPSEPKVKCVAEVKVDGEQLEQLAHDAAVELAGIDRDALLALADILGQTSETDCRGCRLEGSGCAECSSGIAHEAARRIREALGVGDHADA